MLRLFAEYRGCRYHIDFHTNYASAEKQGADWKRTFPQASYYVTDKIDCGPMINGTAFDMFDAMKAQGIKV